MCKNLLLLTCRQRMLITLAALCLLFAQNASADFRKAIEAYQNRDGLTLLAEVQDAVTTKNNDGLTLFLYASLLDSGTSEYDSENGGAKSTLKAILTKLQWNQLRELLIQATNRDSLDTQYYFRRETQFNKDFFRLSLGKKIDPNNLDPKLSNKEYSDARQKIDGKYVSSGSQYAKLKASRLPSTIEQRANAGHTLIQMNLGFEYMNYGTKRTDNADYGCQYLSKKTICQSKDEVEGNYWLKRAAKSYDTYEIRGVDLFANQMCRFLSSSANNNQAVLKQAYLWAIMAINERGNSQSRSCLTTMRRKNILKLAAPKLDAAWSDGEKLNAILYSKANELPNWITEIRKELTQADLPVFKTGGLEVYKDGRVLLSFVPLHGTPYNTPSSFKVPHINAQPETVEKFLADLKKTGFYEWKVTDYIHGYCGDFDACHMMERTFITRNGNSVHRVILDIASPGKLEPLDRKWLGVQRMAILYSLTEQYFPTKKLRCELGSSEKLKKFCRTRDAEWKSIAKQVATENK